MLRLGVGLMRFGLAALAALGAPIFPSAFAGRQRHRLAPSVHYFPRGKRYTPNGKREVARRLRQIAAGQLRVSA